MATQSFNSPYSIEKRRLCESKALQSSSKTIPPDYKDMELILFPEGSLRNANNTPICEAHLRGKSVALFFADGGDAKCRSFLPFLLQYYRTLNESGSKQKIEIIFVSCDRDVTSFKNTVSHMPWLHIEFGNPLIDILRRHFGVMREHDVPLYGTGARTGVPCLIVIGSDGREEQFLHVSNGREEGERAILRWDWRNTVFTVNDLSFNVVNSNGRPQCYICPKNPDDSQPQQGNISAC